MIISKTKKVYSFELQNRFRKRFDITEIDWRTREFFEELCHDGLYEYDYSKKNKPKLRLTFPLYFICIILLHIFACFKWLFTGSLSLDEKNWAVKKMIQWDKYCRFNLIS